MSACDGCKYWSELCATSLAGGPVLALCLHTMSPKYNRLVHEGCDERAEGRAIDDPCPTADECDVDF